MISIGLGLSVMCCTFGSVVGVLNNIGQAAGILPALTPVRTQVALVTTPTARVIVVTATSAPVAETSAPTVEAMPPTEAPAPTQTIEPTKGPSLALKTYLADVGTHSGEMAKALGEIATLMSNPRPLSNDWKIDVAAQLAAIQLAYQAVEKIDSVPPEAQKLHAAVLDAMGDCNSMTTALARGIDTLDTDDISRATELMRSCGTKTSKSQLLLNELR